MQVFIYQDYIHNNGVLLRRLAATFGRKNTHFIDAQGVIEGMLNNADLLVMPGGADLYNCEKLNGAGNAAIRAFVENGGGYLGICAGAYYACTNIEWAKNTTQEITGARELTFFKDKAIGPIYEFIEDNNIDKSWKNVVPVAFGEMTEPVFYEGGPIFTEGHNETVLARYESLPNTPAAIIACTVSKGLAILSSPHIEYTAQDIQQTLYKHRNPSYDWDSALTSKNLPKDNALWHIVCEKIKQHRKT